MLLSPSFALVFGLEGGDCDTLLLLGIDTISSSASLLLLSVTLLAELILSKFIDGEFISRPLLVSVPLSSSGSVNVDIIAVFGFKWKFYF